MTRSEQMARVRGADTGPEVALRRVLSARGVRYRLKFKVPIGRPDLVFPKQRVAVFIDGCFWHGCPTHYVRPRSGGSFWADKLTANVERDRRHTICLEDHEWMVLRFWEHELDDPDAVAEAIGAALRTDRRRRRVRAWRVARVEVLDVAKDLERRHLVDLRNPALTRHVDGKRYGRSGPRGASAAGRAKGRLRLA